MKTLHNLTELQQDLAFLAGVANDAALGDVLTVAERDVRGGIALNFADSASPTGQPWPARKDAKRHPLLIETGALLGAAMGTGVGGSTRQQGGRVVELVIDKSVKKGGIPGAAAHNFGYPPRNLPQREFFAPKEAVLPSIDETVIDAVDKLLG